MSEFLVQYFSKIVIAVISLLTVLCGGAYVVKIAITKKKMQFVGNENKTKINDGHRNSNVDMDATSGTVCDNQTISIAGSPNAQVHIHATQTENSSSEKSNESTNSNEFIFKKYDLSEIRKRIKILIIDNDIEGIASLRKYLEEEWQVDAIKDLDHYSNSRLLASQIICVDIHDVGVALGYNDGVGLIKGIATKYPNKKLILYSAIASYGDLFEEALAYADKTVSKNNRTEFSSAIERLAKELFNGDKCIDSLYDKCKLVKCLPEGLTRKEFTQCIHAAIDENGNVNADSINGSLKTGEAVAQLISDTITCCTRG